MSAGERQNGVRIRGRNCLSNSKQPKVPHRSNGRSTLSSMVVMWTYSSLVSSHIQPVGKRPLDFCLDTTGPRGTSSSDIAASTAASSWAIGQEAAPSEASATLAPRGAVTRRFGPLASPSLLQPSQTGVPA
eukprot:scaffold40680_cov60-Phaeocystis_antarctica.AAC.6